MTPAIKLAVLLLVLTPVAFAQLSSSQKVKSARLEVDCANILRMKSSDWIAKSTATDGSPVRSTLHAIQVYGDCYDSRTDRLASSLARTGKGPSKAGRGDFRDFEAALTNFTAKALAANRGQSDPLKSAYAALYEKQFRFIFYERYVVAKAGSRPASDQSTDSSPESSLDGVDQMTAAKNRFGKLLAALPDAEIHELHAAFGEVVGSHPIRTAMQLAVYRYAIFLLERATPVQSATSKADAEAFSPPF